MEKKKLVSKVTYEQIEIPAPMKCGGCNFTQEVNVVFAENQKLRTVNWTCPRCGDVKKATMTRLDQ